MARGRALNADGDIYLDGNSIALVSDADEVAQHVSTRLRFFLNSWFLDRSAGTPWFEEIFVKPVNLANVESILKARVLGTDGVQSLERFAMTYDGQTRKLSVAMDATTIYGDISNLTLELGVV